MIEQQVQPQVQPQVQQPQYTPDQIALAARNAYNAGKYDQAKRLHDLYQRVKQQPVQQQVQPQVQPQVQTQDNFQVQTQEQPRPEVPESERDNAFMYGVDQAQNLAGAGIEGLGDFFGFDSWVDYGQAVQAQQQKDIAEGGYVQKYNSFEDAYDKGGLKGLVTHAGQTTASGIPTSGATLIGGGLTGLAMYASAPAWLIGLLGLGTTALGYNQAVGENVLEQKEKLGDYDSTVSIGVGAVNAILDRIGVRKVFKLDQLKKMSPTEIADFLRSKGMGDKAKEFLRAMGIEGLVETTQETTNMLATAAQGGEYTGDEVRQRLTDSFLTGSLVSASIKGGQDTIVAGANLVRGGNSGKSQITSDEEMAAQAYAQRLIKKADENGYDLKDVSIGSTKGARSAVDGTHIDMAEELAQLFKDLKEVLQIKDTDSLELVAKKVQARVAHRKGKNKTKSVVEQEDFRAIRELAGNTREGQRIIQLLHEMNQMTDVHNKGYKGGVSSVTDQFLPVGTSGEGYNVARTTAEYALRPLLSTSAAVSTGGGSIPIQLGLVGAGRAIDKLTGRRSRVQQYVNRYGSGQGQPTPTAPSVREARQEELARQEAEEIRLQEQQAQRAEEDRQANLQRVQEGMPPQFGSPEDIMRDGTGLDRSGIAQVLRVLKANPNTLPSVRRAIEAYEQGIAVGGEMDFALIRNINGFVDKNPDYVQRVREPNEQRAKANIQALQAQRQTQRDINYERGVESNRQFAQQLIDEANADKSIPPVQKAKLIRILSEMALNLGSNPVAKLESQEKRLLDAGADAQFMQKYFTPYAERVMQQQQATAQKLQEDAMDSAPMDVSDSRTVDLDSLARNSDPKDDERTVARPANPDSRNTQRDNTLPTARKSLTYLNTRNPDTTGRTLDFGAGFGINAQELGIDETYEPFADGWQPTYDDPNSLPSNTFDKIISTNVMNVIRPKERAEAIYTLGRALKEGGEAVIQVRSASDVNTLAKSKTAVPQEEPSSYLARNQNGTTQYQKGFKPDELVSEVQDVLGPDFTVEKIPNSVGINGTKVLVKKNKATPSGQTSEQPMSVDQSRQLDIEPNEGSRVSPVMPVGKKPTFDHTVERKANDLELIKGTELEKKIADILKKQVPIKKVKNETDLEYLERAIDFIEENLLTLHDSVSPEYRETARLWYKGANKLSRDLAEKYGVTLEAVAGVMSGISPGMDWFQNYDLGARVIDFYANRQDEVFGDAEYKALMNLVKRSSTKSKKIHRENAEAIKGKKFSELTSPTQQAYFVRFWDDVNATERGFRIISPDGTLGDFATNKDGSKTKTAFSDIAPLAVALRIMNDPSVENISNALGRGHKRRNFYNNILAPDSPDGDVTIDTHAVAASLFLPLSQKSVEVKNNFGTPDSINIGSYGTYPIYAEAYRRAAEKRGLIPREMQSITWEAVRGLFPATWKTQKKNVKAVRAIWKDYVDGKISLEQARGKVYETAGNIGKADWEGDRPDFGLYEGDGVRDDSRELSDNRLPGRNQFGVGSDPSTGILQSAQEVAPPEDVKMGINVRTDADNNYADLIVTGQKRFETRDSDSLRPYVGQRIGIVETGAGKAKLVGYATVGEPKKVGKKEFDATRNEHLVPEGSAFDIKQGQSKFLYEMIDPVKLDQPIDASSTSGIVARNISNISNQTPGPLLTVDESSQLPLALPMPEVSEVKDQMPLAEAVVDGITHIGKKGTIFEDGIATMPEAIYLAYLMNTSLKFYDSAAEFMEATGAESTTMGQHLAVTGSESQIFVRKDQSDLSILMTTIHEISHAAEFRPVIPEGETTAETVYKYNANAKAAKSVDNQFKNSLRNKFSNIFTYTRALRGGADNIPVITADGKTYPMDGGKLLTEKQAVKMKNEIDKIQKMEIGPARDRKLGTEPLRATELSTVKEILRRRNDREPTQDDIDSFMRDNKNIVRQAFRDYQKYTKNDAEFAVDPVIFYMVDPKGFKKVAPVTAEFIRNHFKGTPNLPLKFHANPLTVVMAIVMAGLAKMGGEEEEEMDAGALTLQPAILSA